MTWLRLDGGFATHPKVKRVGPIGLYVHVRALCYVATHQTDGFLPAECLEELTTGLGEISLRDGPRDTVNRRSSWVSAASKDWPIKLSMAGLWEPVEGGYRIHDYLAWNPTKQYLDDLHHTRAEAGRKGGLAKALAIARHVPAVCQPSKPSKRLARNVTVRNEDQKLLSGSGSNDDHSPAEPEPEPASKVINFKAEVAAIIAHLADTKGAT